VHGTKEHKIVAPIHLQICVDLFCMS